MGTGPSTPTSSASGARDTRSFFFFFFSYILTHGLYPYYKEKLVRRIQGAVGFTLGTDSATFKLNGLSKLVDIVIRWENS